jgi:hypothetical protein
MLGGKVSGDLLYFPLVWNLCSSVDDSMAIKICFCSGGMVRRYSPLHGWMMSLECSRGILCSPVSRTTHNPLDTSCALHSVRDSSILDGSKDRGK